jgi:secondary thiamine-phosphate synthase enzyme
LPEHERNVRDATSAAQLVEASFEGAKLQAAKRRATGRVAAGAGVGSWHAGRDDRIVPRKLSAYQEVIEIRTSGRGFTNVTAKVEQVVKNSRLTTALCTVFIRHTSASLVIQENADPNVLRDLGEWVADLAPESRPWIHDDEGPDDMPAHARSAITKTSETIPVTAGRLALGTWQGLYVWEHRAIPHARQLVVHVSGD